MTVPPPFAGSGAALAETLPDPVALGRRIAAAAAVSPGTAGGVDGLARACITLLGQIGVAVEIVRAREGCLVVRSTPRSPGLSPAACTLVASWLEALPGAAPGPAGPATVTESSCAARGERWCMHTLLWREGAAAGRPLVMAPPAAPPLPGPPAAVPLPGPPPPQPLPRPPATQALGAPAAQPLAASPAASSLPSPPVPQPLRRALTFAPQVAPPSSLAAPGVAAAALAPDGAGSRALVGPADRTATGPAVGGVATRTGTEAADAPAVPRPRRWAWVARRAWLLVAGLLAGTAGGYVAGSSGAPSYTSTAVLEVQSGTSTVATASANGANALAITYAALIPEDQALLSRLAARLHTTPALVSRRLAVQAVAGTALIDVKVAAGAPAAAVAATNDVARLLTSATPPGRAIAPGSVTLVSTARVATRAGSLRKYGLPVGALVGLCVGAAAALAAERIDRRIDDLDPLGEAAGCAATWFPGGISTDEMVRSLERTGGDDVAVLALRDPQLGAALRLRRSLSVGGTYDEGALRVEAGPSFERAPGWLTAGSGPTVLVVGQGERLAAVEEVVERLRLVGREPAWAVLVPPADRSAAAGAR